MRVPPPFLLKAERPSKASRAPALQSMYRTKSPTALAGKTVSYFPAGISILFACHCRRWRIFSSTDAIETLEKSRVATPSKVDRVRLCDFPVISTRPAGWS